MQKKLSDVFVQSPSNEMKLDRYNRNRTIMYYSYVLACIPKHKFVDVGKGNSWRLLNIIALERHMPRECLTGVLSCPLLYAYLRTTIAKSPSESKF